MPTDTVTALARRFRQRRGDGAVGRPMTWRDMPVGVLVGLCTPIEGLVFTPCRRGPAELIRRSGGPHSAWCRTRPRAVGSATPRHGDAPDAIAPVGIELLRESGADGYHPARSLRSPRPRSTRRCTWPAGRSHRRLPRRGPSEQQAASTIVDLTGVHPARPASGSVSVERVAEVLGLEPASLIA